MERKLLQVYWYFLRMVNSEPSKIRKAGSLVELRRLEVATLEREITNDLALSMSEIETLLNQLVEVDRISIERKDGLIKVRFRKLALPRSTDSSVGDDEREYGDYWFDDFRIDYLQYVETNLSKKSLDNAKRVMKLFCNFIEKKKLAQIQPSDGEDYKQMRKSQKVHVSDATINMDIRTLKAAFKFAVNTGKLREHPFQSVKLIRCPRKQMATFAQSEFNHLISLVREPWLVDIVKFDVNTGLRRGEIMNLKWQDVDLANKRMIIQSSEGYQVKHGKYRNVPLNKEALAIVSSQRRVAEWVFTTNEGKRFRDEFVSKKFKDYIRICKLSEELHFHSLRATFATWAISAGMSIYAVRTILGHASVKTTEPYAAYEMDALQEAVEKIAIFVEQGEREFKAPMKLVSEEAS